MYETGRLDKTEKARDQLTKMGKCEMFLGISWLRRSAASASLTSSSYGVRERCELLEGTGEDYCISIICSGK